MSERWHRAAALVEQIDRYTANSESDSTDWFGNSQERLEHSPPLTECSTRDTSKRLPFTRGERT